MLQTYIICLQIFLQHQKEHMFTRWKVYLHLKTDIMSPERIYNSVLGSTNQPYFPCLFQMHLVTNMQED